MFLYDANGRVLNTKFNILTQPVAKAGTHVKTEMSWDHIAQVIPFKVKIALPTSFIQGALLMTSTSIILHS